ncbi:hypothetical protein R3P38DRAFT_3113748 [Favolaschia claudopus]|uniref:Uncharacterized protein n=1 Tax=Favolaschia claudopus TaxID=2862362 RepID=A0AAV9ZHG9_9AGAR
MRFLVLLACAFAAVTSALPQPVYVAQRDPVNTCARGDDSESSRCIGGGGPARPPREVENRFKGLNAPGGN